MNKKIKKNQNGFTLIEIMIAITVFAIGILAVAAMQISAIKGNSYASHLSEASTITQNQMERFVLCNYADLDDAAVNLNDNGNSQGVTGVQYTTVCTIDDDQPIPNTKTISISTTWTEKGAPKKVTMDYIKANCD